MFKATFIFLLAVAISCAYPDEGRPAPAEPGVRLPRATCDLLSFSVGGASAGHSLCAAHCLALRRGFRGGSCVNGVCNCRK